jgi:hypothetical protein
MDVPEKVGTRQPSATPHHCVSFMLDPVLDRHFRKRLQVLFPVITVSSPLVNHW